MANKGASIRDVINRRQKVRAEAAWKPGRIKKKEGEPSAESTEGRI